MKKERSSVEKGTEKLEFIQHNAENVVRLINKAKGTPSKFLVGDLFLLICVLREDIQDVIDEELFK